MAEKKVIEVEIKGEGNVQSLKSQLREATQEVAKLSDKYGATSKQAIDAAKRAAELKDVIGDSKALVDSFNPDAKFNALSSSIGGVLNGFQAFQGGLGLIGVEGEAVEETLLKVQSAMALSQGLQGLGEARDSFKQLGAVAKETFSGIKGAILATGIGAFLVLLGTVAAYWDEIKEAVGGVNEEQEALNSTMEEYKKGATDAVKVTTEVKTSFDLARQGVISKEEALKTYNDALGATFGTATSLNEAEALYAQKTDAYIKATALRAQATALFEKAAQKQADALSAGLEDQTTFFDKLSSVSITGDINQQKLADKQTKRVEELRKKSNEQSELLNSVAADLLKQAETIENANGIASKSEQDLAADRQKRYEDEKARIEEYRKLRLQTARDIEDAEIALMKEGTQKQIAEINARYARLIQDTNTNNKLLLDERKKLTKLYEEQRNEEIKAQLLAEAEDIGRLKQRGVDDLSIRTEQANAEIKLKVETDKAKAEQDKKSKAEELDREKQLNDAKFQAASNVLSTIGSLAELFAGKSRKSQERAFKIQKAAQIAQATIDTYKSATGAFSAFASIPIVGPALGGIAAAAAVAAGIVNIKKIAQTKFDSGGGEGSTPSAGGAVSFAGPQAPTGPQQNFNLVSPSGQNPLSGLGTNAPQKAYVVGGEVTTQQELERKAVKTATFG